MRVVGESDRSCILLYLCYVACMDQWGLQMFQKYPVNEKTISSCGPLIYRLGRANIPYLYALFEKQADQHVRPESSDWESAKCLGYIMTKKEYCHCVLEIRP